MMLRSPCDNCGRYDYGAIRVSDKIYCRKCLKKTGMDYQWVVDYNQALSELNERIV